MRYGSLNIADARCAKSIYNPEMHIHIISKAVVLAVGILTILRYFAGNAITKNIQGIYERLHS